MKIVNCLWANLVILVIICLVLPEFNSSEIGIGALKKKYMNRKLRGDQDTASTKSTSPVAASTTGSDKSKSQELPDIPVYYQGWIKYLHYTEKESQKPKAFYKNTEYAYQSKRNLSAEEFAKKDNNGYTTTVDSLDLNYISPIPDDDHFIGGIKDFGKFDEGYCFKIEANIPEEQFTPSADKTKPDKALSQVWVLCLDTEKEKTQLENTMINLKLKLQHSQGIYLEVQNGKVHQQGQAGSMNEMVDSATQFGPSSTNSTLDGYWILLQDWTQCTLKCGGGQQFQQLMCVPPRTGGKPCQGTAIRTRPCNTQACPQAQTVQKAVNPIVSGASNNNTLSPIIKMMAVSKRPQRYDKCFVKESDVLMEKNDESTKEMPIKPRIPIRLVLNDRTVSAYIDDTLTNRAVTFVLDETVFVRIADEKRCFKLKNNIKSAMFCQLDSQGGDFVEEWDYDFNLFKNQCKKKRTISDKVLPEEQKLEAEFKNKVDQVKAEIVMEIAEKNKKAVEESEEIKLTKKVQQVQSTSMMALQKETKLEELLEKEEQAKEDTETKELENLIEAEKKKEECLNKAIKEKELENQMNLAKSHAEEAIKNIQEQTKKEIAKKRLEIKKKIAEMRKKQDRKKAALRSQIMSIRTTIANRLNQFNKNGNPDQCVNGSTEVQRENYCGKSFADNYVKYQDCMTVDSFCYVCCENEFGDFHVLERDKCYAKCDSTKVES